MIPVITIDGPSGAGKGTLCGLLASSLGFHLLDSGALYRLTALSALNKEISLDLESQISDIAGSLDIEFIPSDSGVKILLEGQEVSLAIREEQVGMAASRVAAYPMVRAALLQRQRDFCMSPGLVADGRDMGTVVFPDAPVKIFLTASAEERAKRRVLQLQQVGKPADYTVILEDIQKRDEQDQNRAESPLVPAEDAISLDSTKLSVQEVLVCVNDIVDEKLGNKIGNK